MRRSATGVDCACDALGHPSTVERHAGKPSPEIEDSDCARGSISDGPFSPSLVDINHQRTPALRRAGFPALMLTRSATSRS